MEKVSQFHGVGRFAPRFAFCALLLVLCLAGGGGAWGESVPENAFIHFFVVPVQGEGRAEAVEILKQKLEAWAGGFTELGLASGGERLANGTVGRQENAAFLVAAPTDISRQIEEHVATHFGEERPFVLVWRGNCSLYRN